MEKRMLVALGVSWGVCISLFAQAPNLSFLPQGAPPSRPDLPSERPVATLGQPLLTPPLTPAPPPVITPPVITPPVITPPAVDLTIAESYTTLPRPNRKSTRLNSSHIQKSRMPSSA